MKQLLLLLPLLLGTQAIAGDLGPADFDPDRIHSHRAAKKHRHSEFVQEDNFTVLCGAWNNKTMPCSVSFKGEFLRVDNSAGIKPEQVMHIQFATASDAYIIYRDSSGTIVRAGFLDQYAKYGFAFQSRLIRWMNGD